MEKLKLKPIKTNNNFFNRNNYITLISNREYETIRIRNLHLTTKLENKQKQLKKKYKIKKIRTKNSINFFVFQVSKFQIIEKIKLAIE